MSNTINYNTFIQTVKRKGNLSPTEVLLGIFLLTLLSKSNKTFYIKENCGYNIFENTETSTFFNIDKNTKYKILEKVYGNALNKSYPSWISGGNPGSTSYRCSYEIGDGSKSENIFSLNYYNEIEKSKIKNLKQYVKDITQNEIQLENVITDRTSSIIAYQYLKDKNKIVYNKTNSLKNTLKIKLNLNIDEEKITLFDDKHYFIALPSFSNKDKSHFEFIDKFIKLLYEKTPYQNLILLSGSNEDKIYCHKKYNIKTTEHYDEIKKEFKTGEIKSKSNFKNILKDILYVQESNAAFIHLEPLIKKYWNELNYDFKIRKQWYKPKSFDLCCLLAKENNILNYGFSTNNSN